jgi:DNA-binding NtrC family response regulator
MLGEHFLQRAADRAGKSVPTLHETSREKLRHHHWPGNVRELQNVMAGALLVCRGPVVMPEHLEIDASSGDRTPGEKVALGGIQEAIDWALSSESTSLYPLLHDMLERELIRSALAASDGNQSRVAGRLGIARNTLRARMQKYGLE